MARSMTVKNRFMEALYGDGHTIDIIDPNCRVSMGNLDTFHSGSSISRPANFVLRLFMSLHEDIF